MEAIDTTTTSRVYFFSSTCPVSLPDQVCLPQIFKKENQSQTVYKRRTPKGI